jgi:thiamine biosynthesis lipoprotein
MTAASTPIARTRFRALGTTAELSVTDPERLAIAEHVLRTEPQAIDAACSRFRADSEISRLHRHAGTAVAISPLLAQALRVALGATELTDGLVDPTVGAAVAQWGYDRDFAAINRNNPPPTPPAGPVPGWWRVQLDISGNEAVLRRGVVLDLGAIAKAPAADRAVTRAAHAAGCGVLVGLGGDLAAAGSAPPGGWRIIVGDDHAHPDPHRDPVVAVASGGLATSSTTCRAWQRARQRVHHIVDPRTGAMPDPLWRTVSVAASSCMEANTASTAAVVLGTNAPKWLAKRQLPARRITVNGLIRTVADWPEELRADLAGTTP